MRTNIIVSNADKSRKAVIKYNAEYEEYTVTFFIDDITQKAADYYTSDLEDAESTAKYFVNREAMKV